MGKCEERVTGVKVALHLAEVSFKRPKRKNDSARDTKACFDLVKCAVKTLSIDTAVVDPVLAYQGAGECDEVFLKYALGAVSAKDGFIYAGTLKKPIYIRWRTTLRDCV